jgi:large subunit ribosomal protein L20
MPRSVNSVASRQKKKKVLEQVKGQFGRRKNVWTVAKNAYEKSLGYAYRDRRNKKRTFRGIWINRISAGARENGLSYSVLMGLLHKKDIQLNRKVLADLAMNHPDAFKAVVEAAKA